MADPDTKVKVTKDEKIEIYREPRGEVQMMTSDEEGLTVKARRVGDALGDLVDSTLDRTAKAAKIKTKELLTSNKLEPGYAAARKDAAEIGRLGSRVTVLARHFEDTMTTITEQEYEDQVRLLTGYKKLIEEQINVIDSRIHFVKRVH